MKCTQSSDGYYILSILVKKLTVVTHVMQSSSNETSTLVYDSTKFKQMKGNTYASNSWADVESQAWPKDMSSAWHKVRKVSIPAWSISRV